MSSEVMTPPPQPPSESTLFARSLKTYEDITFGQNKTCRAIVAFDFELFDRTCIKISNDYDENKCNYDEIMDEIFQVGETWLSRDLVSSVVDSIAAKHGWVKAIRRNEIVCNRNGNGHSSRDYTTGELQVNCTLTIRLSG